MKSFVRFSNVNWPLEGVAGYKSVYYSRLKLSGFEGAPHNWYLMSVSKHTQGNNFFIAVILDL